MLSLNFVLAALLVGQASATTFTSPDQLGGKSYDFIVVGGGTAGNVLASRLSENPSTNVLVIEAGGSDVGNLAIEVPFLGVALPNTPVDWNYTTTTQFTSPGIQGRAIHYARGKVLGGCSAINLLTWNICSTDLWDKWAQLTGDSGWAWNNVKQYYLKTSKLVAPADGRDTTGMVDPSVHGNGPVDVSLSGYPLPLDHRVINASQQLGGEWAYNVDINNGKNLGTVYIQNSVGGGERSDSATAYLHPAENRTNLDILLNTQVTKLVQSGTDSGKPAFRTVQVAQSSAGTRYTFSASKEVLLAAGVIGSPQILQLSGIGPKSVLNSLGISTVVDNSDVGSGLADHPLVPLYYKVNANDTWDPVLHDNALFGQTLQQWETSRTGLFTNSPANTQAYYRVPDLGLVFNLFQDPAPGPNSAHLENIYINAFADFSGAGAPDGRWMTILTALVAPTSRGSVQIKSSDPFVYPTIDPNLLKTPFDAYAILHAIRATQEFLQADSFNGYIAAPRDDLKAALADPLNILLWKYIADNSITVNHPMGTAAMASASSSKGVVDPSLKVKGVSGLRVIDASIFPTVAGCHPQAIVYTVAERAAALIKSQYSL